MTAHPAIKPIVVRFHDGDLVVAERFANGLAHELPDLVGGAGFVDDGRVGGGIGDLRQPQLDVNRAYARRALLFTHPPAFPLPAGIELVVRELRPPEDTPWLVPSPVERPEPPTVP